MAVKKRGISFVVLAFALQYCTKTFTNQLSKIYIYRCSTKSCTFLDEDLKKPLLDNDTEVSSDMKQS